VKLFSRKKEVKTVEKNDDSAFRTHEAQNALADWAADRAGGVKKGKDFLEIGAELYSRTLLVRGWPSSIKPDWARRARCFPCRRRQT
jgi:hypothetical protein